MFPSKRLHYVEPPPHVKRTAGNFDRGDWPIYFIATIVEYVRSCSHLHPYFLMAVNELRDDYIDYLESFCLNGGVFYIDSGIHNLTMDHVRKHADAGLTMDQALALPPDEIDGFEKLFARYLKIIERLGNISWGYIELDQGGRENKIKTRERLESMGLRPIPVYHPLNDGWDYFDHLAENYDRICFGNVVYADKTTRRKLIATAFERRRKYPYLWIHLLGFTANEWLNAYPMTSCDSSSWLGMRLWGIGNEYAMNRKFSPLMQGMSTVLGGGADAVKTHDASDKVAAYQHAMLVRNWKNHLAELETLGFDLCPPVLGGQEKD